MGGKHRYSLIRTTGGQINIGPQLRVGANLQLQGSLTVRDILFYYRARYYDAEIGRFISEDPLGFAAGINFYAYVNNNPINFNDPGGNCPSCVGAVTSVALGGAVRFFTGGDVFDGSAILQDAALGAVGAGIFSKINTIRKFNEINQLTNSGRNLVTSGAAPKFTSTISQNVTRTEANSLGNSFTGQGSLFTFRSPAIKFRTGIVQANFESNIINSVGNPKVITNIHTTVTSLGTAVTDGLLGGTVGGPGSSASGGFVIYQNKINSNQLKFVYAK